MGASITLAGESLIAQKQAARQNVAVARFILANVPGLDTSLPVDRTAGLPAADQIVHTEPVQHEGYLATNKVVYSLLMGTDVGDFDFNWIGLETADGVLLIVAYVPLQQKRREVPPLQSGNNLTRNIIWEYDGAQELSGIDVPASTWQFDYSAIFNQINVTLADLQEQLDTKVDQDGFTPPQTVNLDGPTLVYPGSTNTYKITDFNRFSIFSATTSVGTVTLSADTLTLTIPSNAAQGLISLGVTRDGIKVPFKIPLGAAAIEAPTIKSPAAGATGVSFEPTVTAAAFNVFPAGYDTHVKTRIQIARDAAFTDFVVNQLVTTDLLSISLNALGKRLEPSVRYYLRLTFVGNTLESAWSSVVALNTASVYIRKPSILSPVDGAEKVSPSLIVTGDAFSVYGGSDTQSAGRLQLSVSSDFANPFYDSGWNIAQLTTFQPPSAAPFATQIFARIKYKGTVLGETDWSTVVRFTTSDMLKGVYTQLTAGATKRASACGAVLNGKLYVLGGVNSQYLSDFWCYDFSTGKWVQLISDYIERSGASMVAFEGKLYVVGGMSGNTSPTWRKELKVYDPVTETWSAKAVPPNSRIEHCAVVIGRKMYLWGGMQGNTPYGPAAIWVYDFDANSWTTIGSVPSATVHCDIAVVDGKLYSYEGNFMKVFNPADGSWKALTALQTARDAGRLSVVEGKIYLYGGYRIVNSTPLYFDELWVYDPITDKWQQLPSGGGVHGSHVQVVVNGEICVFGGVTSSGVYLNSLIKIA